MQISIQDVSVWYKKSEANVLNKISFDMDTTNYIGLLGPNGAGKSTLMKLITNELIPNSGTITVNGIPISKNEKELKNNLGYLPQYFGLFDELNITDYLNYIATLKSTDITQKDIDEILEKTNLLKKKNSKIRTLSGGQRQRVGIAQALLGDSKILIFDEPTVGLDPEERVYFRNLFLERSKDSIILISTHIIEDIQSVCNRLIILNNGSIVFNDLPEELIKKSIGHIGILPENEYINKNLSYPIVSKIMTKKGIYVRFISNDGLNQYLDDEPTLEDAYMYLLAKTSLRGI